MFISSRIVRSVGNHSGSVSVEVEVTLQGGEKMAMGLIGKAIHAGVEDRPRFEDEEWPVVLLGKYWGTDNGGSSSLASDLGVEECRRVWMAEAYRHAEVERNYAWYCWQESRLRPGLEVYAQKLAERTKRLNQVLRAFNS